MIGTPKFRKILDTPYIFLNKPQFLRELQENLKHDYFFLIRLIFFLFSFRNCHRSSLLSDHRGTSRNSPKFIFGAPKQEHRNGSHQIKPNVGGAHTKKVSQMDKGDWESTRPDLSAPLSAFIFMPSLSTTMLTHLSFPNFNPAAAHRKHLNKQKI